MLFIMGDGDDDNGERLMAIVSIQSYLIESPRLIELHRMSLLP